MFEEQSSKEKALAHVSKSHHIFCAQPERAKKGRMSKKPITTTKFKAKAPKHVSKWKPKHPCFVPPTSPYHISSLITRCSHPYQQGKGSDKRRTPSEREHALLPCHYYPTLSWIDAKQFIELIHGAPCSALCPRALRLRAFVLGASCFLLDVHTQAREGKEKSRKQILLPPLISLPQMTMTLCLSA